MIPYFFYEGQLRKYLTQLANVFVGLKVQTGNGECAEPELISVPIRIGSKDRVVAAIEAGNTQNKPFSLPMLALHMTGLSLPASRKGIGVIDRRVYLPEGGIYPTDLKTIERLMPIPFVMNVDVGIYASNTDQLYQILEQILILFDYTMQLQFNDAPFDWTKITMLELVGMNNEENYPMGADRRVINWTLNFNLPIWMSPPVDVRQDLIQSIKVRIGDLDSLTLDEVDQDGNLVPFITDPYTQFSIDAPTTVDPVDPGGSEAVNPGTQPYP